jgi:hypothetical protein
MTVPFREINEGLAELYAKFGGVALLAEGNSVPELQARVKKYLQKAQAAKGRGDKTAEKYWNDRMKFAANKLHKAQNSPAASVPAAPAAAAPKSAAAPATGARKPRPGKGRKGNSFKAIGHEIAKHLHKAVVKAGGHAVGKIPFLSQGKLGKRKIPGLMRKSTAQKLGRKVTDLALKGAGKVGGAAAKLAGKGIAKAAKGAATLGRKAASAYKTHRAAKASTSQYRKNAKLATKGSADYRKKLDAKKKKYQKSQTKLADKGAADFRVKMQQKVREKHAELQHHKHQAKMREKEHKAELKKKEQDFKKADQAAGEFKKVAQKHSTAADRMRKEIERHQAMTKISPKLVKHAKERFHHVRKTIGNLFKVTKNKIKQGSFGHEVKAKVQRATDRLRQRYSAKHVKGGKKTEPAALNHPDIAA